MTKVFFIVAASFVLARSENDLFRLLQHVRDLSPDPSLNPFSGSGLTLEVNVTVQLIALQEVDEVKMTTLWYIMSYYSYNHPLLRWDPAKYGNRTAITVDGGIWHPGLMPCVSLDDNLQSSSLQKFKITHDGVVTSNFVAETLNPCGLNFGLMPYDVQTCLFCLGFVSDGDFERKFKVIMSPDLTLLNNINWSASKNVAVSIYFEPQGPFFIDEAIIEVSIARNSQFYTVMVVMPIIFVSAYVIFNQITYEDKGGSYYGGVGFLGFVFGYVATELPKQQTIPALGWFVFAIVANLSLHGYAQMTLREVKRLIKARRKKRTLMRCPETEIDRKMANWQREWLSFEHLPWLLGAISALILALTYPLIFTHEDLETTAARISRRASEWADKSALDTSIGLSKELPTDLCCD